MSHTNQYFISTFYKFTPYNDLDSIKKGLERAASLNHIKGLIILGNEGLNSTVCATSEQELNHFKNYIREITQDPELMFKDSHSHITPFRRFKIKIREEIVTTGAKDLAAHSEKNFHLSPTEWNRVLKTEKDIALIDTRNWYETQIGTFKGAINPKIDIFKEFPKFVEEQNLPKDKKILIFCTGGIRCEKGIFDLQRRGYNNVYQLHGGIINYMKEFPNDQFEGECFVFDHRVSLDQNLNPSQTYRLCPHCGQPGKVKINCSRCDTEAIVCDDCLNLEWKKETCSKNCSYQYSAHQKKGKHQDRNFSDDI